MSGKPIEKERICDVLTVNWAKDHFKCEYKKIKSTFILDMDAGSSLALFLFLLLLLLFEFFRIFHALWIDMMAKDEWNVFKYKPTRSFCKLLCTHRKQINTQNIQYVRMHGKVRMDVCVHRYKAIRHNIRTYLCIWKIKIEREKNSQNTNRESCICKTHNIIRYRTENVCCSKTACNDARKRIIAQTQYLRNYLNVINYLSFLHFCFWYLKTVLSHLKCHNHTLYKRIHTRKTILLRKRKANRRRKWTTTTKIAAAREKNRLHTFSHNISNNSIS